MYSDCTPCGFSADALGGDSLLIKNKNTTYYILISESISRV